MTKRSSKNRKMSTKTKELVAVCYAEDMEQARDYESLLKNNDIPAMVKEEYEESADEKTLAVLVPEEYLNEAQIIIESQSSYDDIYDFSSEDDEDDLIDGISDYDY